MFVSAPETSLRDRVATMYNKVGTVHSGDRLEVLEKQRRFLRVRTDAGQEGWIEERSLVSQEIYDGFQELALDNATLPVQAHGTTRAELNMHLTAARDSDHLYQLKEGEKVEVLKRTTAEKNPPKAPAVSKASKAALPAKPGSTATQKPAPADKQPQANSAATAHATTAAIASNPVPAPKPVMEDWYLVRNSAGHVGWVLMRMIDLDVPVEVAQYAEGQRIVGYFVLNTVQDGDKQVPQYLMLLNEPKDGLAWDYNQIRIFTWNRARHRYETAYRERNMEGYLPAKTGHREFDKEGDLPTFTIRKQGDEGQIAEVTYKLNGPIVRRVLTPEQEAAEKAKRASGAPRTTKKPTQANSSPAHRHHKHK